MCLICALLRNKRESDIVLQYVKSRNACTVRFLVMTIALSCRYRRGPLVDGWLWRCLLQCTLSDWRRQPPQQLFSLALFWGQCTISLLLQGYWLHFAHGDLYVKKVDHCPALYGMTGVWFKYCVEFQHIKASKGDEFSLKLNAGCFG